MTHVVTELCIDCKFTTCVENCPVDAFHQHDRMVVINPLVCIDCSMCIDECPVDAIVTENNDHPNMLELIQYAEEASQVWPLITKVGSNIQNPDPNHDKKWENRPIINKR